ncbi:hypothetical protein H8356DRAFT_120617 [Neocallimastix lanati (nom. inval.)]|uniref:Uncharacterized protein n=1 Tax=Neocallimastix californiae TaxID=1754190 RepID=A0A1Y2ERT6_9FUNG|nr:hypothetical protein H8356DRAFT_120617 [Neocallimastix sp. JGI-2020a]ORY73555.1 hypothetical protein LY90DRAFT_172846 [Neocallimastix californiae]|eukprot:ORY73555.1 hypothetical protein LY90DRAFT_172846 [Neocallimastix californiae]
MEESNIKTLKIISLVMLLLSILYLNIFGIVLSSMTYYGLQKKNICLLQSLLIPNLYEVIIIVIYFIGIFIKIKTSYKSNNSEYLEIIISYLLIILSLIQAAFQIYLSLNIYKLILKPFGTGTRTLNENELVFVYSTTEEISPPEEDPLPAYSPPANKLPTYYETQNDNNEIVERNESNDANASSSETLSNAITPNEEINSVSYISNNNLNLNSQENTTIDIAEITRDNLSDVSISINPPPYSLYPNNNS